MNKTNQILKEVLAEIKPKEEPKEPQRFVAKINELLKKKKIKATAVIGGSFAKNTWLKGDYDVDIFIKFGLNYKSDELSNILEKAIKQLKPERIHGSRDYFHIYNKFKYEIVPVLDIKKPEQAKNVMDFTPWHVAWVNKKGAKLKDEIRLTKKFCKAQKVYGAESYIRGFSGHVVDIMTIYYKGFLPLMKAAAKWKPKVVLDYGNKLKGKALFVLNKSKTQSPLIIVDPVQPDRNAAAALSNEMFDRFVQAAKEFIKKPSKDFFIEKKTDFEALAKKGHLVKIIAEPVKEKEDIAGTKLAKAFSHLKEKLSEFGIIEAGWDWDKKKNATLWFVLKNKKLPEQQEIEGPPTDKKEHVDAFRQKHKQTFIRNNRIFALEKRNHTTPESLIKEALKSNYIKERTRKCSLN